MTLPSLSQAIQIASEIFAKDVKIVSVQVQVQMGTVTMEVSIDRSGRVTEAA